MSLAQTLAHFDLELQTRVVADTNPFGLGTILVQLHGTSAKVVSYGHRSLSVIERKYSQTFLEVEQFMMYILGTEFEPVTHHKLLNFIYNKAAHKPIPQIERWSHRLQSFRYKVVYKPGKCLWLCIIA